MKIHRKDAKADADDMKDAQQMDVSQLEGVCNQMGPTLDDNE